MISLRKGGAGIAPRDGCGKDSEPNVLFQLGKVLESVNVVEGMLYISSQSTSDGRMQLTVTFKIGSDVDEAQVLVQNRVSIAEPRLPEDVHLSRVRPVMCGT